MTTSEPPTALPTRNDKSDVPLSLPHTLPSPTLPHLPPSTTQPTAPTKTLTHEQAEVLDAWEKTPTHEQAEVLDAWECGRNVRVQAFPGSGKTFVLTEALRRHKGGCQVILAYNNQLATSMKNIIVSHADLENVYCFTFHGLASHCIALAADDVMLRTVLAEAESGRLPRKQLLISALLVDEAQDVNELHIAAMRACLSINANTQIMVVGDAQQRLYDYGEYPACEAFFAHPESFFDSARTWQRNEFTISHRVVRPVASLVSTFFPGVRMSSANPNETTSIQLHLISKWDLGATLLSIVRSTRTTTRTIESCAVLSSTVRGNYPLKSALNHLSQHEVPIYLQATTACDERLLRGKLVVSSWHSSKGTEYDTTIVIVPAHYDLNPLFVALTRSRNRMHLVLLDGEVPLGLLATLTELQMRDERISFDHHAVMSLLHAESGGGGGDGGGGGSVDAPARRAAPPPGATVCMDRWRADPSLLQHARVSNPRQMDATVPPRSIVVVCEQRQIAEDVSPVYLAAVVAFLEHEVSASVRAVQDILHPLRKWPEEQDEAIRRGNSARFVSPRMPAAHLLSGSLRSQLEEAWRKPTKDAADWCTIGAAICAWNGYHHLMRQVLPCAGWVDASVFERACTNARKFLEGKRPLFDVRLTGIVNERLVHVRTHASMVEHAARFTWNNITASDRAEACIRAALHHARRCAIIEVGTSHVEIVHCDDIGHLLLDRTMIA